MAMPADQKTVAAPSSKTALMIDTLALASLSARSATPAACAYLPQSLITALFRKS